MKINERTLISLSTSNAPSDKEGWLWKRGEVNKNFQKRYFVLKGNLLFYFDKKTDREPVGVVILEGCTIELAEEEREKFAFKVAFHGEGKRTYVLGTDSQELLEEWMKVLACASYDYMKLMVLELQQQLAEADEVSRLNGGSAVRSSQSQNSIKDAQNNGAKASERTNPFNQGDQAKVPKQSWVVYHGELGKKICSDQKVWSENVARKTVSVQ